MADQVRVEGKVSREVTRHTPGVNARFAFAKKAGATPRGILRDALSQMVFTVFLNLFIFY